jgi:hypothetical protein
MAPDHRLRNVAIRILLFLVLLAGLSADAHGQKLNVGIQVLPGAPGRLLIQVSGPSQSTWSFSDSYAGVLGLGNRIRGFQAFDSDEREVAVRKIAPGEFASAEPGVKFKYEIELAPPARSSDAALISWLDSEGGVLLLSDLLPALKVARTANARVKVSAHFALPAGWTSYSPEAQGDQGQIETTDIERTTIAVGKKLHRSPRTIVNKTFALVTDEGWAFADDDALDTVADVLKVHTELGQLPCESTALILLPLPQASSANKWSAQTRGCTVTLLMGKLPSKVSALSHLGLALTHELFHLWAPNGLALSGDYDWFYEGFTMYEAARAAMRLDLLTFPQLLNAIADAHDGSSGANAQDLSLIEASKQRWTGGSSSVYSKAMVVAFLYDLNLRYHSKGKRSLDDVYRKIFREHLGKPNSSTTESDGNAVVVAGLREELSTPEFVDHFVIARSVIDLSKELAPFGLHVEKPALRTHIYVNEQLTGRQRDLLRQLGYNEPRPR